MSNLTPLNLLAGAGLMKNSGLAMSPELQAAAAAYNSQGISGAVQALYPELTEEQKATLAEIPRCLSGLWPDGVDRPATPSGIGVVDEIMSSAGQLMSNGTVGFISILGQATAYAASAFNFQGAVAQVQGKNFNDLGLTFNNFSDLATGGATSQFNAETLKGLGTEMPRLGSLFDTSDLYSMFKPGSVCKQIINLGLGSVGDLESRLTAAGVDVSDLVNEDQAVIQSVMSEIKGSDLNEILSVAECRPHKPESILTLADVLSINYMMGPEVTGQVTSFDSLSNKLGNIGGKFSTPLQIGSLFSGLEVKDYPSLASKDKPVSDDLVEELQSSMGTGRGVFKNPTVLDIVGSPTGIGFTDNIKACLDVQQNLIENNAAVRNLYQYLTSTAAVDIDTDELMSLINDVNSEPEIQTELSDANSKLVDAATAIANERKNQAIAGLNLDQGVPTGNLTSSLGMVNQISAMALDPMSLGTYELLSSLITNDEYGQALQASLAESRNLSKFAAVGIDTGQKLDAMAYARQLRS